MITPIPPAYSIGKAKPVVFENKVPGPGEYFYEDVFKKKANFYSFARSPRKIHEFYGVPGPGLYSPLDLENKGKGFSICRGPRVLSDARTVSPGPGDYSYQVLQRKYQYSISKARNKSHDFNDSPGPGYYTPNLAASLENAPRVHFPRQERMPKKSFLTPAPGQYDLNVFKSPGFTIPKAIPRMKKMQTPGPGLYEIPSTIGIASLKSKS